MADDIENAVETVRRDYKFEATESHRPKQTGEKQDGGQAFWFWREKNPDASVFDAWQAGFDHARSGGIK